MIPDGQLLREYVRKGSQTAFAALVERHLPLVYNACLREVHDASLAEDVTQVVFVLLAQKAPALQTHTALAGWLFQTARFASRTARGQESRRKRMEQKLIQEMDAQSQTAETVWWESLEPMLHPALQSLNAKDRETVLLRFFEGRTVQETGVALGVSEGAAQMRIARAVEKLRRYFQRHGVAVPAAMLFGLLTARAARAVPEVCRIATLQRAAGTVAGHLPASTQSTTSLDKLTRGVKRAMWTHKILSALLLSSVLLIPGGSYSWIAERRLATAVTAPPPRISIADHSLSDDPQLDRKVTITSEGISLGELFTQVAKKTGVRIEADAYTADDKVIVFGPARPLKEIMADIAALYNDVWLHSNDDGRHTYRLTRQAPARDNEDRLGSAATHKLLAHLEEQVQALQETPEQLAKRPESDPIRQILSTPGGRINTSILGRLNAEQRRQLVDQWRVSLPVIALDSAQKDGIENLFHGQLFEEMRKDPLFTSGSAIPPAEIPRDQMDKHEIKFEVLNASGVDRQSTDTTIFLSGPAGFNTAVATFSTRSKFLFPVHGNPYTGAKIAARAPLPDSTLTGAALTGAWPDRLRALAEKSGVPVIADYYRSKAIFVPGADDTPAAPDPSLAALDAFCKPEGYLWWNRDRTLLFRKRDWYNQRLYETPDRWVLRLSERLKEQQGNPSYSDVLSLLDLSTNQIVGLSESLGHPTDRRLLIGLRELLAAAAAIPGDKDRPIYRGVLSSPTENNLRRASLLPDPADGRQHLLLSAFAQAFDPNFFANPDLDEFGFLFYNDTNFAQRSQISDIAVTIAIMLYMDHKGQSGMRAGYILALPKTLPDDRRNKTVVQTEP